MLTIGVSLILLGYILLYSGFRHAHADGSPYTPLDVLREAFSPGKGK